MLNNESKYGENKPDISEKPMVIVEYADGDCDDLHVDKCDLASLKSVHDKLNSRMEWGIERIDFIEKGYSGLEDDVEGRLMQIHDIADVAQELMANQREEMLVKLYTPVTALVGILAKEISTVKKYLSILELRNTHEAVEKAETLRAEGKSEP